MLCCPRGASADSFEAAQAAAREGRYRDVVEILNKVVDDPEIVGNERVVALANRGIAFSLLGAYERARQDLLAAIEMEPEHRLALNHLGLLVERIDEDTGAAIAFYQRAADLGFAPAQVNLADVLVRRRDYARAASLYEKAAAEDYALAFVPLGRLLMTGRGTGRDPVQAVEWFWRAADSGVVEAHFELGAARAEGRGIATDVRAAAAHFRIAAIQGHGEAQNRLGYLYRRGNGVAQDFLEAAKWYQLAADQGNVQAMNRLAWLLATCPVENVCNGEAAVEMAQRAAEQASTPSIMDSLAAAWARVGRFDRATRILEDVVRELPPSSPLRDRFSERLEQYRQRRPHQL